MLATADGFDTACAERQPNEQSYRIKLKYSRQKYDAQKTLEAFVAGLQKRPTLKDWRRRRVR